MLPNPNQEKKRTPNHGTAPKKDLSNTYEVCHECKRYLTFLTIFTASLVFAVGVCVVRDLCEWEVLGTMGGYRRVVQGLLRAGLDDKMGHLFGIAVDEEIYLNEGM